MKLYVMRHGPAEDQVESGVDSDRPLSASGRERVTRVARALLEGGEQPASIITSPLVRAVQTAEIIALLTGLHERGGTVEVRRAVAPGGHGAALAHRLAAADGKRVMFVGHEPDLSALVGELVGEMDRGFDKAMVVGLRLPADGGEARLRFVLDPRSLKWDPDDRGAT